MRKELLLALVVIVSEGTALPVVAAAEELEEVASPTVDPATPGTVVVPKTSM